MNTRMQISIGEVALCHHQTRTRQLYFDLSDIEFLVPPSEIDEYQVDGRTIQFSSLSARNRYAAEWIFSKFDMSDSTFASQLFAKAKELWRNEIGHEDMASGRLLAAGALSLDIFATAVSLIKEGADVWGVIHLLEAAIPYLKVIEINSLIDLCDCTYESLRDDMVGGSLYLVLERWYSLNPQEAMQLHRQLLEVPISSGISLFGTALMAIAQSDFQLATDLAIKDTCSEIPIRSEIGIWIIGRLLQMPNALPESLATLQDLVIKKIDASQETVRLRAIQSAIEALSVTDVFDKVIKGLCKSGVQDVLARTAQQMWLKSDCFILRPDLPEWLSLMCALLPENQNNISVLDNALAIFVQRTEIQPLILDILGQWVEKHGRNGAYDFTFADSFPRTIESIGQFEELRSKLITSWLLHDCKRLPASMQRILDAWPKAFLMKLDIQQINELDQPGLIFLARRILGYLHGHDHMLSLTFSMLESNKSQERIYPFLSSLLVDEIGYDYPSWTLEALHAAAQGMPIHSEFLLRIAELLRLKMEKLDALPRAKELVPPLRLRRLFVLARAKQMSKAKSEAEKNSIINKIATRISIKAGKGTFSYQQNAYSEPTEMHTFSHSIAIPRREVFDPIGNAMRGLQFRIAKREE